MTLDSRKLRRAALNNFLSYRCCSFFLDLSPLAFPEIADFRYVKLLLQQYHWCIFNVFFTTRIMREFMICKPRQSLDIHLEIRHSTSVDCIIERVKETLFLGMKPFFGNQILQMWVEKYQNLLALSIKQVFAFPLLHCLHYTIL